MEQLQKESSSLDTHCSLYEECDGRCSTKRSDSPAPGGVDAWVLRCRRADEQMTGVPAPWCSICAWSSGVPVGLRSDTQVASGFDFAGAFVNDHAALSWVARDHDESGSERWVLHATPNWTVTHLNMPSDDVAALLAQALAERFNFGFRPAYVAAHRWLYATPVRPLLERYLWDAKLRIGAVGDWCQGPRLEGAFLSGDALGAAITP